VFLSPLRLLWTYLSCQWLQSSELQQVLRSTDEVGMQLYTAKTTGHRAAQSTIGFHPTDDLFDLVGGEFVS
jgi:hypothetical protein